MLYMDFSPDHGWSPPQIRPYGPLNLDPASSCFHYCPNVFEGLKVRRVLARRQHILTRPQAYLGPDGTPRLFRPQLNMERMVRSAERVALPVSTPGPSFPIHAHTNLVTTSHSTQMPC
jgi:branched-chain amino acid aminotransferase